MRTMLNDRADARFETGLGGFVMSALGHVWTAPWQELSDLMQHGRVRSRVRPVDAARMAAGPNAVRG